MERGYVYLFTIILALAVNCSANAQKTKILKTDSLKTDSLKTVSLNVKKWRFNIGLKSSILYDKAENTSLKRVKTPDGYNDVTSISAIELDKYSKFNVYYFAPGIYLGIERRSAFFIKSFVALGIGVKYDMEISRLLFQTESTDINGFHYYLDELNYFNTISIPFSVHIRFSKKKGKDRIILGIQPDFVFALMQIQRSSWSDKIFYRVSVPLKNDVVLRINENNEFKKWGYSFFADILLFRKMDLGLQFYPNILYNQNYVDYKNNPYKGINFSFYNISIGYKFSL